MLCLGFMYIHFINININIIIIIIIIIIIFTIVIIIIIIVTLIIFIAINRTVPNTLRPRLLMCHFACETFSLIFRIGILYILIQFSLKFVPNGQINNRPTLAQIMAGLQSGGRSLFEPLKALPRQIGVHEASLCVCWCWKCYVPAQS